MHPVARVTHVVKVCANTVDFDFLVPIFILAFFEVLFGDQGFVVDLFFGVCASVLASETVAIIVGVCVVPVQEEYMVQWMRVLTRGSVGGGGEGVYMRIHTY